MASETASNRAGRSKQLGLSLLGLPGTSQKKLWNSAMKGGNIGIPVRSTEFP